MNRPTRTVSVLATVVGMALAAGEATAGAAVSIGQTGTSLGGCGAKSTYLQDTVAGGPSYSSTSPGVITAWSTASGSVAPYNAKLVIVRPNPSGGTDQYVALAKDQLRTVTSANQLNTFIGVHVPIEPGQQLALFGGSFPCVFSTGQVGDRFRFQLGTNPEPPIGTSLPYTGNSTGFRLNAQAVVEPDADRDGFGDETQDQCPANASTQGPCPVSPVTSTTPVQKKCKRKKHKHSASSAKKKHCKKKKKK